MIDAVLTPTERCWLAYARSVVDDAEHQAACRRLGGSPAHQGVDDVDLRWPGYLGAHARAGETVLAVGNVHRNFASGAITSGQRDLLVDTTRRWRDGEAPDEEYLRAVRRVYLAGLRGWTVGKHLAYAVGVLGLGLDEIVYLNAARCQYPEVPPRLPRAAVTKLALQRLCLARFPLEDLLGWLKPPLVLFTSTSAYDAVATAGGGVADAGPLSVCLHQLNGTLARPLDLPDRVLPVGTRREVWAAAVTGHIERSA